MSTGLEGGIHEAKLMEVQGYPGAEDIRSSSLRFGAQEAREGDQGQAERNQREDWYVLSPDILTGRKAYRWTGVKESDTGLAPPHLWDIAADRQRMQEEQPLQVARCTKIISDENPEKNKYVINVKQIAKFVVNLGERVSPTDIEEGMRVGYVYRLGWNMRGKADFKAASTATSTRSSYRYRPRSTLQ